MRYAIFSDIHANLQAWNAIHRDMLELEADVLVCLGDVVGYGPLPEEVLTSIRKATTNFVMGNHDAAAVGIVDPKLFNSQAESAIIWTRKQLSSDSKKFLRKTPLKIESDDLLFVHAEISEPGRFGYIESGEDAERNLADNEHFVTFVGHTHHPAIFDLDTDGHVYPLPGADARLDPTHRYIVNVGSVGEPRNPDDIRAHYVIYDSAKRDLYFRRIAFDTEAYRLDLDATSLRHRPYFLQIADHNAALEEESQRAMIDMQPQESSLPYLDQFHNAGATEVITVTAEEGERNKPKPRPNARRGKRRAVLLGGAIAVLLVAGIGAMTFWLSGKARQTPIAASEAAPTGAPPTPAPEPQAIGEPPLVAKADLPEPPSIAETTGPITLIPAAVPAPAPIPIRVQAPVPIPVPVPVPAPVQPQPEVLAYWRMDEVTAGFTLSDEIGRFPLQMISPGRPTDPLAPDPVALTGARNSSGLIPGIWREPKPSGAFDLSADRSFTFEGWLMSSGEKNPIFIAGMPSNEDPGWRLDIRAAEDADSLGSIRFVHHGNGSPVKIQSSKIELFDPTPHHFAIVWDHDAGSPGVGTLRLFYDGAMVATGGVPHEILIASDPTAFQIGNTSNPSRLALDELRFCDSPLEPKQFLSLGKSPVSVAPIAFMIDVGAPTSLYAGNNSPAHSEGAVAKDHSHWIHVDPASSIPMPQSNATLANGETYPIPLTIEVDTLNIGVAHAPLQPAPPVSKPAAGGGAIFATALMDSAQPGDGGNAIGIRVRGFEPGNYKVYLTPVVADNLKAGARFGIGVDLPGDSWVADRPDAKGMRERRYRAGAAAIDDARWIRGQNYFKQTVRVTSPDDYVVAIVSSKVPELPAAIPYLQIVKIGASNLPRRVPIEFRFDGGSYENQATSRSPLIDKVSAMGSHGFHEDTIKPVPAPAGGQALSGELTNPTSTPKDYFSFSFDVVGKGAILSGYSLEVSGPQKLSYQVSLHDLRGDNKAMLGRRAPAPEKLSWQGDGTLAGGKSLGIRLAPDTYSIRISGLSTDGRKLLTIDNVKVVFDEL